MPNPRQQLRKLLNSGKTVIAPGCYDPFSALVIQQLGFDATYMGDSALGTLVGCSTPLLSMHEVVEAASRITQVLNIPLICDGGPGYGEAVHTMRFIRLLERAGVAGTQIEDQIFPRRMTAGGGTRDDEWFVRVVPLEEHLDKLKSALQAREDPDFLIIGRTDAWFSVGGTFEEAVRRCAAMLEIGVDMVFLANSGGRGYEARDVDRLREALPNAPIMVLGVKGATREWFQRVPNLVCYPMDGFAASYRAMRDTWKLLKENGLLEPGRDRGETHEEIAQMLNIRKMLAVEQATVEKRK